VNARPIHWYWIPIRVTHTGFARIQAAEPEEAIELIETGAFSEDDLVLDDLEQYAVTGAPHVQETT
jgi:hypothetical protein